MNWDKLKENVDTFLKLEVHAVFLTIAGVALAIAGRKDEGMLVLGGAMALFKGRQSQ